jgi:hypothetical protein
MKSFVVHARELNDPILVKLAAELRKGNKEMIPGVTTALIHEENEPHETGD